jgi:16S rRNA (cytidine1402-2'-O)-methyltransferase
MPGTLFVVATPIGNLEDISGRALRVLRDVSVIAAEDTRRTAHLLSRYAIVTPTLSLHEHNEARKSASLVARLAQGDDIALVSDAGAPTISDPGQRFIRAAIDAGIRVEAVPGPSAIITALTVSGLPSDSFAFLGFPPVRSKDRRKWFERAKAMGGTVVFFEAPHRIVRTLEELRAVVGNCQISLGRELTKVHEQLVRGPISDVLVQVQNPRGEFTVVAYIGQSTESGPPSGASPGLMMAEFCRMTETGASSRRAAVLALAKRHQMRPKQVYRLIEDAKKSGV